MLLLCIDDDPDDVQVFRDVVNAINPSFTCLVAPDGAKAIDILNTGVSLNCIFLDINMPLMNGRDTLREIRKNAMFKNIPVIMFSTTMNEIEVDECKKIGATEFLIKPARFRDLQQAVAEVINRYE